MTSDGGGIKDFTIIGAGPTGLFAAFYAGLRGMSTKIIEALPEPGGQLSVLYPPPPPAASREAQRAAP